MDVQSLFPSAERLRGGEKDNSRREVRQSRGEDEFILADLVVAGRYRQYSSMPADPGEHKHAPLDNKPGPDPGPDNNIDVEAAHDASADTPADYAHYYRVYSTLEVSDTRQRMEERVRRMKRAGGECPFREANGQCGKVFIRCGDRLQFSERETGTDRKKLHKCNYERTSLGDRVLIVDDDESMQDFCKSTFALFLSYDPRKIATAGSVPQAVEILKRAKVLGRRFGLVISDIDMPEKSGYDLVNELYIRNFNIEILLMKAEGERFRPPSGYLGDTEVLPNQRFVSGILTKPFHSDTLVQTVKKLRFGWGT